MCPGARAEIDDVISAPHRCFVMFDNDERVPFCAQRGQSLEQPHIIARMQTNGWLIQHVENTAQIRAELRRQANPLRFSST